ncbi:helix-turn-helix transcriptional regulator [Haladaptatus sp. CMSO5]|uniref:helix-turn-helix transcriptional regulator n=1 Tax=unclassified Haladaptatus TaxID=2622732 RepID=UPI003FA5DB9D
MKELLRLLLRRDDVVAQIRAGPVDIRTLTDAVSVSRPTVHRCLKQLIEHEVVTETPRGYVLTSYGSLFFDQYQSYIAETETIHENRDLILALDDPSHLSGRVFQDAKFTRAVPFAPEKPIAEIESIVEDATKIRGFSPVVVGRYVSLFHEKVTEETLDAELIISPDVFDYLAETWPEQLKEALSMGLTVFVTDETLPYGLILIDEPTAQLCLVFYEDGSLRGVVQNDQPDVIEWGTDLYEAYRRRAHEPSISSE